MKKIWVMLQWENSHLLSYIEGSDTGADSATLNWCDSLQVLGKRLQSIINKSMLWAVRFNPTGLCSQRITNKPQRSYADTTQALIHQKVLRGILITFPPFFY